MTAASVDLRKMPPSFRRILQASGLRISDVTFRLIRPIPHRCTFRIPQPAGWGLFIPAYKRDAAETLRIPQPAGWGSLISTYLGR